MAEQKQVDKSLDQLADEIQNRQQRVLAMILFYRWAKRENIELPDAPLAYNLEPGFADSVINLLADLYLNMKIKPKKKLHPSLVSVCKAALPEIQKVYSAIKKVGFTWRVSEADWREAALNCFDNSKDNFQAIKREYLEDNSLFAFRSGHEKDDFIGGMLQKIMKDLEFGFYGRNLLREASLKK